MMGKPDDESPLRDYFAGQALQAYLSMRETASEIAHDDLVGNKLVEGCYAWADLMLKERSK